MPTLHSTIPVFVHTHETVIDGTIGFAVPRIRRDVADGSKRLCLEDVVSLLLAELINMASAWAASRQGAP